MERITGRRSSFVEIAQKDPRSLIDNRLKIIFRDYYVTQTN